MKKFLFSTLLLSSGLLSAQITLENSFTADELTVYTSSTETYYVSVGDWVSDSGGLSSIKIYNSNFTLRNEFFPHIPSGYSMKVMNPEYNPNACIISKGIFDLDDKLDIVVFFENGHRALIRIYNEDGVLIKDFGQNYYYHSEIDDPDRFSVFHDSAANTNKLRIVWGIGGSDWDSATSYTTSIYSLPSTSLNISNDFAQRGLKVYPNPTQTNLNITNPKNGSNKLQIFNINGQLVKSFDFENDEETITISVNDLSKGTYIIKAGDFSSKFIMK